MPNSNQSSTQQSPLPPGSSLPRLWVLLGAFAAFIGLADSAYLTVDHYVTLPLPCTITHGCETVLTSKYAMVGPIPLALIGVAFYLVALITALYLATSDAPPRKAVLFYILVTIAGAFMSTIFIGVIEAILIHAYCQYCLLSAVTSFLMFFFGIPLWRRSPTTASVQGI